jgi:hypothetical protein
MMASESFISWETGVTLVQVANETVAEKMHTNPVATRFNRPRFLGIALYSL